MRVVATVATELLVPSLRALERLDPDVARRARESGLAILARHGLPLGGFSDLDVRIPHEVAIALLDNAVRVSGDPGFALHAGRDIARGDLGVFDLLTRSAPTLGESMRLVGRYLALLHDGAVIDVSVEGELAVWRHRLLPGLESSIAANEYVVASFLFSAQHFLGFAAVPNEVQFMHAPPQHRALYEPLFATEVRFGCDTNGMVFPRLALDLPLQAGDPVLLALLTRYADELLRRLPREQPFVQRLRDAIRSRLGDDGAGLSELAATLNMSESSVQRRLQAEGTTHTELVESVRRELALELLEQTDLNVSEVAFRLGFAHRPGFHRAFKRWYGISPTQHRERAARSAFYRFYRSGS